MKRDKDFQRGLKAASDFLKLFILPEFCAGYSDMISQKELNETIEEIANKILELKDLERKE